MESLFGPPSEPVDILAFVNSAVEVRSGDLHSVQLPREDIMCECSVSDLRDYLSDAWNNPTISAHLLKSHEQSIVSLSSPSKPLKSKRRAHVGNSDALTPQVATLQRDLDEIELSSWKLKGDSVSFMRTSKNAEQNAFAQVISGPDSLDSSDGKAIITVTLYDKLSWGAGIVTRASQHALLSSQSLGHIFDLLRCPSDGLTMNSAQPISLSEEQLQPATNTDGCAICIDDIVYGDDLQMNYADKLLLHLQSISKASSMSKATTAIHQTPLSALSLRVNQPYWLLHHGNCEHFVVVDQIRLQHPSDALFGYPLMLQVTPPLLDLCRACSKVPALVSVVGDVRLGESPCLMCGPCWRNMGDRQGASQIIIPLPRSDFAPRDVLQAG